jgi:hypothetical protein
MAAGEAGGAGDFFDKLVGDLGGPVEDTAGLTQVDRRGPQRVAHEVRLFQLAQQLAYFRVGGLGVHHSGQQRELLGAVLGAAFGHVGLLVPAQEACARGQHGRLAQSAEKPVVGLFDRPRHISSEKG